MVSHSPLMAVFASLVKQYHMQSVIIIAFSELYSMYSTLPLTALSPTELHGPLLNHADLSTNKLEQGDCSPDTTPTFNPDYCLLAPAVHADLHHRYSSAQTLKETKNKMSAIMLNTVQYVYTVHCA